MCDDQKKQNFRGYHQANSKPGASNQEKKNARIETKNYRRRET